MNPSDIFDSFLALSVLMIAIVVIAAIAGIVDNYLDPHCNCADMRRQEQENRGVEL